MEDLPHFLEKAITENEEVRVSDWVKQALEKAKELTIHAHEKELADELIQQAFQEAANKGYAIGIALAAAFDLFVAADYYRSIAHKGWYYCPIGEPMLFYPFTNTCPRCVLKGQFYYEKANKPESGSIGQATSRLLSVFLHQLFARANRKLKIYRGVEPSEMDIYNLFDGIITFTGRHIRDEWIERIFDF